MTNPCVERLAVALIGFAVTGGFVCAQQHDDEPAASIPAGDAEAGREFWQRLATSSCKNCHGLTGQGGFGPPLAGRGLTTEDFMRAITSPVIMPHFPQYAEKEMADFAAYFATLPSVPQPGPWRFAIPPDAGHGLLTAFAIGCAQCHGPELETPRHNAGAVDGDFEWFKTHVYDHTSVVREHWALLELPSPPPHIRMGDYTRDRLPESVLADIWSWMTEEGLLTPVTAGLTQPVDTPEGLTYTLTVLNQGLPGKGLVAEDVTIALLLPPSVRVVSASEAGYQGVERGGEAGPAAAVWRVSQIAPKDHLTYHLTLAAPGTAEDDVYALLRWTRAGGKHPESLTIDVGQRPRNFP